MSKVKFLNAFVTTYLGLLEKRRSRMFLFSLIVGLTLTLGSFLPSLQFDFEFTTLFPADDPDTQLYRKHIEEFGLEEQFMFLLIQNDYRLFKADFLAKIKAVEKTLNDHESVKHVISPVSMNRLISGSMESRIYHVPKEKRDMKRATIMAKRLIKQSGNNMTLEG